MYDLNYLYEVTDRKPDLINQIINEFNSTMQKDVKEMQVAIDEKDVTKILSISHRIKGSSAIIGATCLRSTVTKLESMAKAGKQKECLKYWEKFSFELSSIMDSLIKKNIF